MISRNSEADDPTLGLPRLLCLHGGGTNATIFRAQCRVLISALKSKCRLCFAQAPSPSQAGPDVTLVYGDWGPFRAWLRWRPEDPERDAQLAVREIETSLRTAMAEDDEKGATGEWVGLLGFSQGAKICASLLLSQQIRTEKHGAQSIIGPTFRFAVLLAGRGPLVSLGPELITVPGVVDAASFPVTTLPAEDRPLKTEDLLRIPTIHVHGLKDSGLRLHQELLNRYCDPRCIRLVEWDGEHRVPIRTADVAAVVNEILAVGKETGVFGES